MSHGEALRSHTTRILTPALQIAQSRGIFMCVFVAQPVGLAWKSQNQFVDLGVVYYMIPSDRSSHTAATLLR